MRIPIFLLYPLFWLYAILIYIWKKSWDWNFLKTFQAKVPVISVGNITSGGTGKTPTISWLVTFFEAYNKKTIIFSRGYLSMGKHTKLLLNISVTRKLLQELGDEPILLSTIHPSTPIVVQKKRKQAIKLYQSISDIALLDDGMQHLAVKRDLNLVLIDAVNGLGNQKILPLGPLRENITALKRADVILITRSNLANPDAIINKIQNFILKGTPIFKSNIVVKNIINSQTKENVSIEFLKSKKVFFFSGIGNPKSFELLIQKLGCKIIGNQVFPDHYSYSVKELENIKQNLKKEDGIAITTEKDWIKINTMIGGIANFFVLKIEVQPEENFKAYLYKRYIEKTPLSKNLTQ